MSPENKDQYYQQRLPACQNVFNNQNKFKRSKKNNQTAVHSILEGFGIIYWKKKEKYPAFLS